MAEKNVEKVTVAESLTFLPFNQENAISQLLTLSAVKTLVGIEFKVSLSLDNCQLTIGVVVQSNVSEKIKSLFKSGTLKSILNVARFDINQYQIISCIGSETLKVSQSLLKVLFHFHAAGIIIPEDVVEKV